MNTNFFVAEDEVFNPNKVLTRKEMDAFIGDRGIKSYAGVLKKDNKLFYNFIRVKVAEGKNCVDAIYARKAIVSNGCLRNDFFSFAAFRSCRPTPWNRADRATNSPSIRESLRPMKPSLCPGSDSWMRISACGSSSRTSAR